MFAVVALDFELALTFSITSTAKMSFKKVVHNSWFVLLSDRGSRKSISSPTYPSVVLESGRT